MDSSVGGNPYEPTSITPDNTSPPTISLCSGRRREDRPSTPRDACMLTDKCCDRGTILFLAKYFVEERFLEYSERSEKAKHD